MTLHRFPGVAFHEVARHAEGAAERNKRRSEVAQPVLRHLIIQNHPAPARGADRCRLTDKALALPPQQFPEPPIPLEVPFPAHGLSPVLISLGVQQCPFPAPGRFGPGAVVMGLEPFIQIRGPAAVRPVNAADDVDEAGHGPF